MYTAMNFKNDALNLIDQKKLPHNETWVECRKLKEVAHAIEDMTVRGAPAIATAAAYALVLDSREVDARTWGEYRDRFYKNCERLQATRPTAVNLFNALHTIKELAAGWSNE